MKTSLNLLFWGYFLVFLRFEIVIDILPDPLGYFLIALGSYQLSTSYPVAKRAGILATTMIFISLPTVFINVGEAGVFGWSTYAMALMILKLMLVYFLFSILKAIVKDYGEKALIERTNKVYTFYITLNLILLAFTSFSMNLSGYFWDSVGFILMIAGLIMEIIFLVLIRAIRRADSSKVVSDKPE